VLNSDQLQSYQDALERAVYFDLSAYGKIAVTGPDAATFLHNLSTNDIKKLPVGGGCEAFLCNARARTLAHVFISRWKDSPEGVPYLMLDMVPSLREKVLQHLNKYLISEQAEIVDRTQDLALFRIVGPLAGKLLRDEPNSCSFVRHNTQLGLPGVDVFCSIDRAPSLLDELHKEKVDPAPPEVHEVLRIEAGTPEYGKDMDDDRFVMEVGRTAQAISYTKGCYLGQEPIVMARDRGQVNRTLMGVRFADAKEAVAHGSKLLADGGGEVGQVASSAWSPRLQQWIALAYVRRGQQQPGSKVHCDGREGVLAELPFVA
jgi:folate-binding protein YgfZ